MSASNTKSFRLWITALLFGACAMLAQVLLLRALLSAVEENEILLALFYAVWFFGIFLGATLGGSAVVARASSLHSNSRQDACATNATLGLLVLQAALLPLALVSIRTIHATLGLPAAEPIPLTRLIPIVFAHAGPLGFLTGFIFPLLCRMGVSEGRPAEAMARVYGWESLGACAAGAGFTFLLAGRVGATALAFIVAGLVAANAAWASRSLLPRATRPLPARVAYSGFGVTALVVFILATPPMARRIEDWTAARWWRPYGAGLTLVAERETRLQRVALARQAGQFSLLGNGRFTASFPDPSAETALANLLLAERPRPRRILLIGGLSGGLVKHFLAAGAVAIDVTETDPDPDLVKFLLPHLPAEDQRALQDPRVRLIPVDGRWFLKKQKQQAGSLRYDLILCSTPSPSTLALGRTFTREFFTEARAALAPDGLLAFPLAAAVGYYGSEVSGLVGSVARALGEVFPGVVAAPGASILFIASPDPRRPTSDPAELIRRWEGQGLAAPAGFSPLYFHTAFEASPTRLLEKNLARWKREAIPNTDLSPLAPFHALRLWSRTSGSGLGWLFSLAGHVTLKAIFIFLAGGVVLWVIAIYLFRIRHRACRIRGADHVTSGGSDLPTLRALVVIATTGAAGIGASILLLLAFQSLLGYLYHALGALAALFMGGLWLGARAARRPAPRPGFRLALCELGWAAFAAAAALILQFLFARSAALSFPLTAAIIAALMLAAGAASGAEFVLAGQLYEFGVRASARSAPAAINAADHLGACAGALLTGLVLLPALGLIGALLALAALKLAGAVVCAWPGS